MTVRREDSGTRAIGFSLHDEKAARHMGDFVVSVDATCVLTWGGIFSMFFFDTLVVSLLVHRISQSPSPVT